MHSPKVTGCQINYYFICKRKLWLFSKHITMEQNSELVALGKLIDEFSHKRQKKSIMIDGVINIDFIDNQGIIYEVKKSIKMEDAHIWQLKYYLYYLAEKGVKNINWSIGLSKASSERKNHFG